MKLALGVLLVLATGCATVSKTETENASRAPASVMSSGEIGAYHSHREECFHGENAIMNGTANANLAEVETACDSAIVAGCNFYNSRNLQNVKAADNESAANMCLLVTGYKTIEYFGFVGQYDDQCKKSYNTAVQQGTAADYYNNGCNPDPLISCLSPKEKSKVPQSYVKNPAACGVLTSARRLSFIQSLVEGNAGLP